uniref:Uncharacterized protein n=1 Tax=Vitis vinifera TaxID=29760 RepID=F6HTJ7_VITVI
MGPTSFPQNFCVTEFLLEF